jgi:hypothetical protein
MKLAPTERLLGHSRSVALNIVASISFACVAIADEVKFSDLYGHTIFVSYDYFGRFSSIDGSREWNSTSSYAYNVYIGEKGTIFERTTNNLVRGHYGSKTVETVAKLGQTMGETVLPTVTERAAQWQFENGELIRTSGGENWIRRMAITFSHDNEKMTCQLNFKKGLVRVGETKGIVHNSISGQTYEAVSGEFVRKACNIVEGNQLDN